MTRASCQARRALRLATKTALSFSAVALLSVGLTSLVLLDDRQERFESAIIERQLLLAKNRGIALRDNLGLAVSELQRLSEMAGIDLADDDSEPERQLLHQAWRQSPFLNAAVELIDVEGRCRWAEPEHERCQDRDFTEAPWFRVAIESTGPSFAHSTDRDGTGKIGMLVPIRRHGETVGILRGIIDVKHDRMFAPALEEELPDSTRILLVAPNGTILYTSPGTRASAYRDAIETVRGGSAGTRIVGVGERRELLAWAPIGYADLGIVFGWSWASLDSGKAGWRRLGWVLWIVSLIALLSGYGASRIVTRPVLRLAEAVRRARTEPSFRPDRTRRRDEIGSLQKDFSDLLETLAERDARIREDMEKIAHLASSLERRVEERTAELRATQAALVESERLATIGKAGAALSHELRNSLNAISVGIDVLARQANSGKAPGRAVQQQVRAEVSRLRTLSDDLLAFARDPKISRRRSNLARLIEASLAIVAEMPESRAVDFEVRIPEHGLYAKVDPDRLKSVLLNLIRNAVEAASGGDRPARVRVVAEAEGDALSIRVEDSGPGVTPELETEIFQPFVTTKRTGVGLGLATSERFVRAHGGTLTLGTTELGGACFEVRLPETIEESSEAGAA